MDELSGDRLYLDEKLRDAVGSLRRPDAPIRERLESADIHGLTLLQKRNFPDEEGWKEYQAIQADLTKYGEAVEGAGSLPTTLWTMTDEKAAELSDRIIALAARYGQA